MRVPPRELEQDHPDRSLLIEQLVQLYISETGDLYPGQAPDENYLRRVATWMRGDYEWWADFLYTRAAVLVPRFSIGIGDKVNSLLQTSCLACGSRELDFPHLFIPLRISPESHQAAGKKPGTLAAFRRAVKSRVGNRSTKLDVTTRVCLRLIFVVAEARPRRDLDNMAKSVIDALKGHLFGDDRQIDHLNVLRIEAPGEESVHIGVRPTRLNEHSDVLVRQTLVDWAGAYPLELVNFPASGT